MSSVPALVYSAELSNYSAPHEDVYFEQEPPVETVIDAKQIKDKITDYLGAVLARCWYDKELLADLEHNAHRTLRHIGILLPSELEIKVEKPNLQRPRLVIYEHNIERTFKRRVCYLQMIMLAGK